MTRKEGREAKSLLHELEKAASPDLIPHRSDSAPCGASSAPQLDPVVDDKGNTKLHLAAESGDFDEVKRLLDEGGVMEQTNSRGETPLLRGLKKRERNERGDHVDRITELFLDRGCELNGQDRFGQTALIISIQNGNTKLAESLVKRGAEVRLCNNLGMTPLMMSSEHGFTELCTLLLDAGAVINRHDLEGNTSLTMAIKRGQHDVVALLAARGADLELKNP